MGEGIIICDHSWFGGLGITFQRVGNNCLSLDDAKREVEVSGVFSGYFLNRGPKISKSGIGCKKSALSNVRVFCAEN